MIATECFAVLAVVAAAFSIAFSDTRKVVIVSWVAAMSVGGLFLAYGAEFLAFVQWITATLVAISFLIYATMFGEYGPVDNRTARDKVFDAIPAVLAGAAFFAMIWLASSELTSLAPPVGGTTQADLVAVGKAIGERHMVSLELTAFMLLAVLIGTGVISRAEDGEGSQSP